MKKVLFLCTGNYYRSRYAEMRFNHAASQRELGWRASSSGLRVDFEQRWNPGPLSADAATRLDEHGVGSPSDRTRMPIDTTAELLAAADRVIALQDEEHRPMLATRFPEWVERVTYWDVIDTPPGERYDPLDEIDRHLTELIEEIAQP